MPVIRGRELAGMAWRGIGRAAAAKGDARALSRRGNDVLAGEPAGRQRQEQRSEPDRADCRVINQCPFEIGRNFSSLLFFC